MITARYRPRPPCRAVSRQTTLGSRPIRSAITRLRPARRFPGATPPGRRVVRPERSRIPCLVQLALEQPVDSAVDPLAPVTTLDDGGVSGAVGMIISIAPPVVRHRQQAFDLVAGVRQGLQKVHQGAVMRTHSDEIIAGSPLVSMGYWVSHPLFSVR